MPGMNTAVEPIISTLESHASLGAIMTEQGPLPLRSVAVNARIDQLFAQLEVRQGYVNAHAEPIEATYIFPLPDRAAVTRFQSKLGDRVIEGILKERGQARQEYDDAIQQGRRAAIAEEERPNVFTMRVGNILPGEAAEIELTLCMPLAYEEGEATLRFPLVVAPRYIPGKPLGDESVGLGTVNDTDAVPDASRITPPVLLPGYPYPVKLDIQVSLPSEIAKPFCNLPIVASGSAGSHAGWHVHPGQKLDRDFIVRFKVAAPAVTSMLMISPDAGDPTMGTLSITVVPPLPGAAKVQNKPRRIVFVLDRSGSMEGWKLVAARRALGRMIDTLSTRDHFAILAFDTYLEMIPSGKTGQHWYSGADMQRFRAIEELAAIQARGGTEMAKPLEQAVQMLNAESKLDDRILVLITDGQAGNEDQILQLVAPQVKDLRIFTLGVDMAVNEGFLRRLAQLGGGTTEVVESEERLDEVMQRIHRRIAAPVLRNLSWKAEGVQLDAANMVPDQVPDLFAEAPVVIQGRCPLPVKGTVTLQASDEAGQPWSQTLVPVVDSSPVLAACWARTKIRQLEDRYASGRDRDIALTEQIVSLSVKHQVLSRFTAYLAVDRSAVVNPNGQPRTIVQAVESPSGWTEPLMLASLSAMPAGALGGAFDKCARFSMKCMSSDVALAEMLHKRSPLPSVPVDVTSYRQRAAQIIVDTKSRMAVDPAAAWGQFTLKLRELLDDLRSIHATDSILSALENLYTRWQRATDDKQKYLDELMETLQAFADNKPLKPKKKRFQFWK